MGIELNDNCLNTLQLTDDQAIIPNDKDDMENMVRINEVSQLIQKKTKYIWIGTNTGNRILENKLIKAMEHYKYMGSISTGVGTDYR